MKGCAAKAPSIVLRMERPPNRVPLCFISEEPWGVFEWSSVSKATACLSASRRFRRRPALPGGTVSDRGGQKPVSVYRRRSAFSGRSRISLFALGGAAPRPDRVESRWTGNVGSRHTARPRRLDVAVSAAISGAGRTAEHLHAAKVPGAHDHVAKNHRAAVSQLHRQMSVRTHPDEGRGQGSAPLSLCRRVRARTRSRLFRCGRTIDFHVCLARFTRCGLWAGVAHSGFLGRRIAGDERCDAWQQEARHHAIRELEHGLCYTNRALESSGRGRLLRPRPRGFGSRGSIKGLRQRSV